MSHPPRCTWGPCQYHQQGEFIKCDCGDYMNHHGSHERAGVCKHIVCAVLYCAHNYANEYASDFLSIFRAHFEKAARLHLWSLESYHKVLFKEVDADLDPPLNVPSTRADLPSLCGPRPQRELCAFCIEPCTHPAVFCGGGGHKFHQACFSQLKPDFRAPCPVCRWFGCFAVVPEDFWSMVAEQKELVKVS